MLDALHPHWNVTLWCEESVWESVARLCLSPTIPKPLWEEEGAGIFLLSARYPLWTQVEECEQLNAEERREFGVGRKENQWSKRVQGLGRHNRAGHRIQLLAMQKGRRRQIQKDSCPHSHTCGSNTPAWLQQVRNIRGAKPPREPVGTPPKAFPGTREGKGGAGALRNPRQGRTDVPWCR